MRQAKSIAAAAVAAFMLFAAPGTAAADDTQLLQQVQDRAQIERLMWDYARAIDSLDADAYARVFTPDGAFGSTQGHEALRKMVVDIKQDQDARRAKGEHVPPMHHVMSNQTIEFIDRDHARVRYYWQTIFADRTREPPPRLVAIGRGQDDVVRVDGQWLIRLRNIAPQD